MNKTTKRILIELSVLFVLFIALVIFAGHFEKKQIFYPEKHVSMTPGMLSMKFDEVTLVTQDKVKINGWFIPISVHPICFGVGSIIKKPAVIDDKIVIREILNASVLIDHDVIDGAPMTRFINELKKNIENGSGLQDEEN